MADPRFFDRQAPKRLAELAQIAGGDLRAATPDELIGDVSPLDQANKGQISFFDNIRYKEQFASSHASACIVAESAVKFAPAGMALIVCKSPYKSYAFVAQAFYPESFPSADAGPFQNYISRSAHIGAGCRIETGVVIEDGAEIGEGSWIEANAYIGRGVKIGAHCRIGVGATVTHAMIGAHSRLYPGARIGQDGFGFAIDPNGHVKVPQLGRVIIGDHVEIGANTTIDRGAGPDTVIGDGTWIDNLVQIGHNVKIGRGCVLVAQSGVAGSSVLEDYSVLAAQAGIAGHLTIGRGARIGAKSGVMKDVPAGEEQLGAPAMPVKEFMRQVIALKRLTKPQKSE